MKKPLLLLPVAAAAALAVVPASLSADGPKTHIVVKVSISEAGVKLDRTTVTRGYSVSFQISNLGKRPHTFSILGVDSPPIPPGKKAAVDLMFQRTGLYPYTVNVAKHARGLLRVDSPV